MTSDGEARPSREPAPVGWPERPPAGGPVPARAPGPAAPPRYDAPGPAARPPLGPPATPPPPPASAPLRTGSPAPAPAPPTTSRPQPVAAAAAAPPRPAPVAAAATVTASGSRKGGRRARLTVKRIDPWSTLKFSFVYALAGLVVLLVAVVALYAIVDAMGVIDSIRSFLSDLRISAHWLSFGRVFLVTFVVGLINVVLFTAFATLTAFIYNVCTDLVGGVEVTLAERS